MWGVMYCSTNSAMWRQASSNVCRQVHHTADLTPGLTDSLKETSPQSVAYMRSWACWGWYCSPAVVLQPCGGTACHERGREESGLSTVGWVKSPLGPSFPAPARLDPLLVMQPWSIQARLLLRRLRCRHAAVRGRVSGSTGTGGSGISALCATVCQQPTGTPSWQATCRLWCRPQVRCG